MFDEVAFDRGRCGGPGPDGNALAQDTTSEKGKLSYYFGYDYGNNLAELTGRGEQLDINSVVKGLQDAYAKKQPAITADQLKPAVEAFQKREQGRAQQAKAEYDKAAAANKTKSDAFLAKNKSTAGVQTLPSGVQYRVIEAGKGAKPTQASTVQLEVAGPFPSATARRHVLRSRFRPSRSARSRCRPCAIRCCRCRPAPSGK